MLIKYFVAENVEDGPLNCGKGAWQSAKQMYEIAKKMAAEQNIDLTELLNTHLVAWNTNLNLRSRAITGMDLNNEHFTKSVGKRILRFRCEIFTILMRFSRFEVSFR